MDGVFILVGLVLLTLGGDWLVSGAGGVATRFRMSAAVVGATVVAVVTAAPELAVTVRASMRGEPELALGNVVGSNTVNIMLVLAITAVIAPVAIAPGLARRDIPLGFGLGVAVLLMGLDGQIGRIDGVILALVFVAYMVHTLRTARREGGGADSADGESGAEQDATPSPWRAVGLVVAGTAALVVGAEALVTGATAVARSFGVSELVVGLTIVALGTSLPELTASIIAARRGEGDLAVGNVAGSNIVNIGLVLAVPAVVFGGMPVPPIAITQDIPVLIAAAAGLLVVGLLSRRVSRGLGILMVLLYAAYVVWLVSV